MEKPPTYTANNKSQPPGKIFTAMKKRVKFRNPLVTDCHLRGGYDRDKRIIFQTALTYRYIDGPDTCPIKHPRAATGEDDLSNIFSSFSNSETSSANTE
nr:MAG: hypothetical protein [Penaeus monodon endogenous nimavirus]